MPELSQDGKEELALALLLWKDFKCQNNPYSESLGFYTQALAFAKELGVTKELEELIKKILVPFKITLEV